MTDFFNKEEEVETPQTLTIGEKEYTQEQVEAMVQKAEEVDQLESQYNTKFDKVWSGYGRSQNRLKELEEELESLKQAQTQPQFSGDLTPEQVAQARQQARQLGILTTEDPVVTQEDFKKYYEEQRAAERFIEDGRKLEKEIDGSDGRPKFNLESTLEYMAENGVRDLMKGYKLMNEDALDSWKTQQIQKEKGRPFYTQDARSGGREPEPIKVTADNIDQLVRESLGQG